jgi:hypothetical protein
MRARHVEVIDRVAELVGIGLQARTWVGRHLKRLQPLRPFALRLHVKLHHALAHRRIVPMPRDVSDGIEHALSPYPGNSSSTA